MSDRSVNKARGMLVSERWNTHRLLNVVSVSIAVAGVCFVAGSAAFQQYCNVKYANLAVELHPELQTVAKEPIRCGGDWRGLQVEISASDYDRMLAKVIALIDAGRIDCQVNIITPDVSVHTYIEPTKPPKVTE